jgi:hypothetical protein
MRVTHAVSALALAVPVVSVVLAVGLGAAVSGPKPGDAVYPFNPVHVTGADKGTKTCPVCKYGGLPAVQVWVNGDSMENITKIASSLEAAVKSQGTGKLKVFVVFIRPSNVASEDFAAQLKTAAEKANIENVAFTYVDSPRAGAVSTYKINTTDQVKNTVLVYANRKVVANYVNLKGDESGLKTLGDSVSQAVTAN